MPEESLQWIDPLFRYDSLPTDDSIRLLYLDGAPNLNDILRCELISISLSELLGGTYGDVGFAAISYFWGDVQQLQPVFIGSTVMGIGSNLHDALRWYRPPDKPVIVWADGVCINQKDVCIGSFTARAKF
jgi:hypothetical protein